MRCPRPAARAVLDFDSFDLGGRGVPGFWAHLKANVDFDRVAEFITQPSVFPPTLGIGLVHANANGGLRSSYMDMRMCICMRMCLRMCM